MTEWPTGAVKSLLSAFANYIEGGRKVENVGVEPKQYARVDYPDSIVENARRIVENTCTTAAHPSGTATLPTGTGAHPRVTAELLYPSSWDQI